MMFWDDIEYFVLKAKNNTSPINVSLEQLSLLINAELQAQRQAEKDTSETLSKLISVLSEEYTKACEKMQSDDEKEAFLKDMVHMVASEVITASKKLDEEKSNKGDKND
jgi:flagellar motor component MotA